MFLIGRRTVSKRTFWHVRLTKTQISLRIRTVWSVFAVRMKKLCNLSDFALQNAPSDDSNQTAQIRSLIGIFAGRTYSKVRFLSSRCSLFAKSSIYMIIFKWRRNSLSMHNNLWGLVYLVDFPLQCIWDTFCDFLATFLRKRGLFLKGKNCSPREPTNRFFSARDKNIWQCSLYSS